MCIMSIKTLHFFLILSILIVNCGPQLQQQSEKIVEEAGGKIPLKAYFPRLNAEVPLTVFNLDHLFLKGSRNNYDIVVDFKLDYQHKINSLKYKKSKSGGYSAEIEVLLNPIVVNVSISGKYGNTVASNSFQTDVKGSGWYLRTYKEDAKQGALSQALSSAIAEARKNLEPVIFKWIMGCGEVQKYAISVSPEKGQRISLSDSRRFSIKSGKRDVALINIRTGNWPTNAKIRNVNIVPVVKKAIKSEQVDLVEIDGIISREDAVAALRNEYRVLMLIESKYLKKQIENKLIIIDLDKNIQLYESVKKSPSGFQRFFGYTGLVFDVPWCIAMFLPSALIGVIFDLDFDGVLSFLLPVNIGIVRNSVNRRVKRQTRKAALVAKNVIVKNDDIKVTNVQSDDKDIAGNPKTESKSDSVVCVINWDNFADLKTSNTSFSNHPLSHFYIISRRVNSKIDEFLDPREPINIEYRIPAEIPKPKLPPAPVLSKDPFETKEDFYKRVKAAENERQLLVEKLQKKYRADVVERNRTVESLKRAYEIDIQSIKKEQKLKKQQLPSKTIEFTKESFFEVMGSPLLDTSGYDPETQTMYAVLKASSANYNKKISFKVPKEEAKNMYYQLKNTMPVVTFSLNNNEIKFEQIKVHHNGNVYAAIINEKEFTPEIIEVALKDTKISMDSLTQRKLTLQNPNLRDTYLVQAISYGENPLSRGLNYDDDLKPLINNLESAPEDPKKWLFIVAIENYDESDPVIYAENSAMAFKETAQKLFGVSERNTYALIDNKATSGAIKDKLNLLLDRNVKTGDIVYFYYSGHGVPDQETGASYILPKDKVVDYIAREGDFKLEDIYRRLTDSKASRIVTFIDACFSGKTDNTLLFKGVAPAFLHSKNIQFDESKMVLFTAGSNKQFSNSFPEKGHRMFSYYLIQALATRQNITVDLLYRDISVKVHDSSMRKGDAYLQDPQIYGNRKIDLF